MPDRRAFLTSLAVLGASSLAAACRPGATAERGAARSAPDERRGDGFRRLSSIGLQLYTVREAMRADVAGTLARVAALGYTEVEFAGYFGVAPAALRRLLDANGLRAPSMHLQGPTTGDAWRAALDAARVVGHEWIVVPWTDERDRATLDDWRRVADRLNAAATDAHAAGLRFAYHNHDFEFTPTGGGVPYDLLLERTDPALVAMELDVYWAVRAGRDPLAYLTSSPSRVTMLHLKDATAAPARTMVDVGAGTIDWRAILAAAARAGVQHSFVEHDEPADPFASIAASERYLAALRY